jgi:hypothetical protein
MVQPNGHEAAKPRVCAKRRTMRARAEREKEKKKKETLAHRDALA